MKAPIVVLISQAEERCWTYSPTSGWETQAQTSVSSTVYLGPGSPR